MKIYSAKLHSHTIRARELKCWERNFTSPPTCHVSSIVVKLVGWGCVINGATLSSYLIHSSLRTRRVAPLVADHYRCNSTTLFGKIIVTFEPLLRYKTLDDLEWFKLVQYSLFSNWMHNFFTVASTATLLVYPNLILLLHPVSITVEFCRYLCWRSRVNYRRL